MNIKKTLAMSVATIGALSIAAFALVAITPAMAQTAQNGQGNSQSNQGNWQGRGQGAGHMMNGNGQMSMRSGVVGSVTAINGSTLTLASRGFGKNTATTTYTVNAVNATVMKNNATSTLSSIAVGDMIAVKGTVSGTTVTATMIRDGMPMTPHGVNGNKAPGMNFQGNGEPVVAGTVSTVNGTTLTITNSGNTSYTIDASNATVIKAGTGTSTISNIGVGDKVVVQGTVNGTSVTASSVIDQAATNQNSNNHPGFFGEIGQFFKHIFGF